MDDRQPIDGLVRLEEQFERLEAGQREPRRGRTTRRRALVAGALAAVVAVPASASLVEWDPTPAEPAFEEPVARNASPDPSDPVPPERPEHTSASPDARLLDAFGVLRRERTADDRLPDDFLATRLARDISSPEHARLATRTSFDSFYVAPMNPGTLTPERVQDGPPWVCLFGLETGMACNKVDSVRDGYLVLAADRIPGQRRGEVRLAGLVPDGIARVDVQMWPEGPTHTVAVEANVWVVTLNASAQQSPHRIVHRDATGRTRTVREGAR